jgi:hypothetical protein
MVVAEPPQIARGSFGYPHLEIWESDPQWSWSGSTNPKPSIGGGWAISYFFKKRKKKKEKKKKIEK